MHWQSFGEFLAMGKHGLYVWGAVGVMALAMVAEPILVLRSRTRLVRRLKRQGRAERSEARAAEETITPSTRRSRD